MTNRTVVCMHYCTALASADYPCRRALNNVCRIISKSRFEISTSLLSRKHFRKVFGIICIISGRFTKITFTFGSKADWADHGYFRQYDTIQPHFVISVNFCLLADVPVNWPFCASARFPLGSI